MTKYGGYALVTGAGSGIGKGFAEVLAQQGYDLVLVDMNKKSLEAVAKEVKGRHGIKVHTVVQDLSKMDAADKLFNKVDKLNVDIGLLVSNAGAGYIGLIDDQTPEFVNSYLHLMVVNYVLITQKFLPGMVKRGKGGLVYLSSIGSELDFSTLYSASKAFVKHYAVGANLDLSYRNIDVIAVGPGAVRTSIFDLIKDEDPEAYDHIMKMQMKRPEEIAEKALATLGEKPFLVLASFMEKVLYHTYRIGPWFLKKRILKFFLSGRERHVKKREQKEKKKS